MAGAVIIGSGWATFSAGATAGSLAHAALGKNSFLMEPKTLLGVSVPLVAANHIRAYRYQQKMFAKDHYDISGFPLDFYAQNLAIIGFVMSALLTRRFGTGLSTRVGIVALLVSPLPISGPFCFLYILLI